MKILILGLDKTLVGGRGSGDACQRHIKYGQYLEHLDIIVYTNKKEGFKEIRLSEKVTAYPSSSFAKLFFFFDAIKIFKKIIKKHGLDLIISQDPFILGLTGYWLKKRYNLKLEVNFHGDFWGSSYWLKERWINYLLLMISKFVVPRAEAIRVVSHSIEKALVSQGIKENKIRVIPTPVDLEKFESFDQTKVDELRQHYHYKKIILFVGSFVPIKNIPLLLSAFAIIKKSYPDVVLLLIGDGPEKFKIGALINELKLNESVFLLGLVSQSQLVNYYKAAEVLVLPSFSEGMPKVLIEAGNCGLPLISTDVSGARDIIKDNYNGFLVPINDKNKLAEKMLLLLKDNNLSKQMGINNPIFIKKNFGQETEKLIRFWQGIINNYKV